MPLIIKDDALADDPWVAVAPDAPIPEGPAAVVVTLERWQAEREQLQGRNGPLGVRLRSDQPPALIAGDLGRFDLVVLEFPRFQDGRAFSYARLLRERHGFTGEVRAAGNVLRDQLVFMARCGFDAFEAADPKLLEAWHDARREISVVYQPATDARRPAMALRGASAAPLAPREERKVRACAACWAY